ncbi:sugar transferase [Paludibacter sp.]|uniref:sugar transferase n=1 Tax=Paludibacter sp. TaxID=1898105 RepID=UPI001355585E|nr:sugar transferase [Paludibacter sp.]MTK53269.1 sugar transferase [Paludibacter sp.]
MKRKVDIVLSLLGIILLSPLFLIIVLLILTDSGRPVLYRQARTGKGDIPFDILKFRTMIVDADKSSLLTIGLHDNRITRVGYYLRKYKIDEFPQLINVLKGEMSLVGPRPEVTKYTQLYTQQQKEVLSVRPGITDPASILLKNENEMIAASPDPEKFYIEKLIPEKVSINLQYIERMSLKNDLRIIIKTLFAIIH